MDYELMIQTLNLLDDAYKKIESISEFKTDYQEMEKQIIAYKKELNSINPSANNFNQNKMYATKNKDLIFLNKTIKSLNDYIDKMSVSLNLFNDIDTLDQDLLNNNCDKRKLNEQISTLLYDIKNYSKLKNTNSDKLIEIYPTLYKIIKLEYRLKGFSSILNSIIENNIDISYLEKLVKEDTKLLNLDTKDTLQDNIFNIAFNEDNYTNEVIEKLTDKQDDYLESKKEYDDYLELKDEIALNQSEVKRKLKKGKLYIISSIIRTFGPTLLSLIAMGSIYSHLNKNFNEQYTPIKETETIEDTIYYDNKNGTEINYQEYSEIKDKLVIESSVFCFLFDGIVTVLLHSICFLEYIVAFPFAWQLLALIMGDFQYTYIAALGELLASIISYVHDKDKLNIKETGETFSKKQLKELKNNLLKAQKSYNELLEKYNYMNKVLEEKGFNKELSKEYHEVFNEKQLKEENEFNKVLTKQY